MKFEKQFKRKEAKEDVNFLITVLKESEQIREYLKDRLTEIEHERDHLKKIIE